MKPKMKQQSVSVVLPVFNEESTVQFQVKQLTKVLLTTFPSHEILILDDASTDTSWKVLTTLAQKNRRIRVLRHTTNQGIARTLRDLYRHAKHSWIASFSPDGEWEARDIPRLLHELGSYDLVIGVRKRKAYSGIRAALSFFFNTFPQILFGVPLYDAGSNKAFRREVLAIPVISKGVFDEAERIIRATRLGYRVGHIDISHYQTKKRNKVPRISLIMTAIKDIWTVWWTSF